MFDSNATAPFSYATLKDVAGVTSTSTIKRYLDYLEEAFLVRRVECFDYSIRKQKVRPSKLYAGDIGFLRSVAFAVSPNLGARLENLVFHHLKRRSSEVYYHRGRKECDFVIKEGTAITQAIQVSYAMANPSTRERELDGLADAMAQYGLETGTIVTMDEDANAWVDGKRVRIVPAWKWVLGIL